MKAGILITFFVYKLSLINETSYLFVFHKDCSLSTIFRGRALLCFMLHLIVRLPDVRNFMLEDTNG